MIGGYRRPGGAPTIVGKRLVDRYLALRPTEGPRRALERLPIGVLQGLIADAEEFDRRAEQDRRLGVSPHLQGRY